MKWRKEGGPPVWIPSNFDLGLEYLFIFIFINAGWDSGDLDTSVFIIGVGGEIVALMPVSYFEIIK